MPTRSSGSDDKNSSGDTGGGKRGSGGASGGKRGFAAMDPAAQREIAHEGGRAVSRDRKHMSEIGRRGAEARNAERSARRGSQSGSATDASRQDGTAQDNNQGGHG